MDMRLNGNTHRAQKKRMKLDTPRRSFERNRKTNSFPFYNNRFDIKLRAKDIWVALKKTGVTLFDVANPSSRR